MLKPSATELMKMKKIDSRYTLVIATAKRAREIFSTGITFTECNSDKPVSVAVNEIYENKVTLKKYNTDAIVTKESIMNDILEQEAIAEKEGSLDENA